MNKTTVTITLSHVGEDYAEIQIGNAKTAYTIGLGLAGALFPKAVDVE